MSPDFPSIDHVRVGSGFRTVLPPSARRRLQLREGSDLIVQVDDLGVHLLTLEQAAKRSATILAKYFAPDRCLSEELIAGRRAEAARETDE